MTELSLAAEFPGLTRADWLKRVDAVLKGASFEEKLVRSTADGIRLEALHGQIAGPRAARAHLHGCRAGLTRAHQRRYWTYVCKVATRS